MATYIEKPIDRAHHALTALTAVRDLVGDIDHMTTSGDNMAMLLRLIEDKLEDALRDCTSKPQHSNLQSVK